MTQRLELQKLLNAAPVDARQWRVIICCFLVVMLDGFDTAAIGFIAPDIRHHWQLTAGDLAPLFGAGLLGLTAGALLCGPLSDRFGRKRVIEFCVALFGLFSLLSAFSPDLETLVILRFLTGLGLGGAMPNTITMTSEYLPARRRGALVTLMFCGFTLGSAFGGVVSAQLVPLIGWPTGTPIRLSIDNALVDNGVMLPENTIESASMNVTSNLLQSSDMVSILSLRLAQRYAAQHQLAILNLPRIEQKGSVGVFWRKSEAPSLALSRFLHCLSLQSTH